LEYLLQADEFGLNQHLFECMDVPPHPYQTFLPLILKLTSLAHQFVQVEDWVGNKLTRPVKGNEPASVRGHKICAEFPQTFHNIGSVLVPPDSDCVN